jgi:protein gp37
MSDHSTIEWTEATWNPVTGCSVTSPGCKNCYAMRLAGTRLKHHPSREGLTQPGALGPVWTGEVRFNSEWLEQPLQWSRGRMIFVCAHGDLFHESVPDEWIDKVFAVMALAGQHTFQVLTKRAARAREYFAHPVRDSLIGVQVSRLHLKRTGEPVSCWSGLPLPNVWLGVSVERRKEWDERVEHLRQIDAEVRFVSAEPLIDNLGVIDMAGIHWLIVGGESGPGARPMHPAWVRSIRDQCVAANTSFFFKQWGLWSPRDRGRTAVLEAPGLYDYPLLPLGKSVSGRQLDGLQWSEMPKVSALGRTEATQ